MKSQRFGTKTEICLFHTMNVRIVNNALILVVSKQFEKKRTIMHLK